LRDNDQGRIKMERGKLALGTLVVALVLAASPAWAALVKAADWRMDETSGQMTDSSGNGNNGTPTDVARTGSTYIFDRSVWLDLVLLGRTAKCVLSGSAAY
jgi:hypothetical protein